jgi:hypothetical protein
MLYITREPIKFKDKKKAHLFAPIAPGFRISKKGEKRVTDTSKHCAYIRLPDMEVVIIHPEDIREPGHQFIEVHGKEVEEYFCKPAYAALLKRYDVVAVATQII